MGDGFMCVTEISKGNSKSQVTEFLRHALDLDAGIQKITKNTCPAPGAFRIRLAAGHVWKMVAIRPGQGATQTDYLGYAINLAARLLEIDRESVILCHESVKKILNGSAEKAGFYLKAVPVHGRCLRGVDPEDIRTLWEVYRLNNSIRAQSINKITTPT
jgi:class 3 adenylate cyclase